MVGFDDTVGFEEVVGFDETVGLDEAVGLDETVGFDEELGFDELTDDDGLESVIDGAEEVFDEASVEVCSDDVISTEVIDDKSEIRLSMYDE